MLHCEIILCGAIKQLLPLMVFTFSNLHGTLTAVFKEE